MTAITPDEVKMAAVRSWTNFSTSLEELFLISVEWLE